jgi:hypothetical protein
LTPHSCHQINNDEEEEEENCQIINKTNHPTQRGRKRYKMEGPKSWQVNEHQITYLRSKDEDSSSLLLLAKQNSHTSYLHNKPCDHHTKNLMAVPTQAFLIITVSLVMIIYFTHPLILTIVNNCGYFW